MGGEKKPKERGFLVSIAPLIVGLIFVSFFSLIGLRWYLYGYAVVLYASLVYVSGGVVLMIIGFRRFKRFYRGLRDREMYGPPGAETLGEEAAEK